MSLSHRNTTPSERKTAHQKSADAVFPGWIIKALFFVLTFIHFELTLKFSTSKLPHDINLVYISLFSAAVGLAVFLLLSLLPGKVSRIVTPVLLFLIGIGIYVVYLSYREFLVFYDIETMLNGAGGVFGQFMGESMRLVLNFSGITRMLLLLLPCAVSAIFFRPLHLDWRISWQGAVVTLAASLLLTAGTSLLVQNDSTYSASFGSEYNFQTSVSSFGLFTSLRLDLQKLAFGQSGLEFSSSQTNAPVTESERYVPVETLSTEEESASEEIPAESEAVEEEIVYGVNALDIDFEALAIDSTGTLNELASYCAGLTASSQNEYTGLFEGKNLIFLTCEAFSLEAVSEELTPTLYRLMTKGINFTDYYQPASAGTTGGEYENIFGLLPMSGGASMTKTTSRTNYTTISYMLNELGYFGKAYHNNDYTYYSRNETHNNLGFSEGFMGYGNGMEEYVSGVWPESDEEMIAGTLAEYIDEQPFNIYYMTVSGHSAYSQYGNAMSQKNWDLVEDLPYSDKVKAYIAANIELENALTVLVNALEDAGIADDTVIVMGADHFPYGLDDDASPGNMPYLSELYGYTVSNYLERDHNALIIWSGCLEDDDPIVVDSPVSSMDILPTLLNLFGLDFDSRLYPGRDVFSDADALVFNTCYDWKTDLGTYIASSGTFTPASDDTEIPDGYVDTIRQIVRDKINFCQGIQYADFYGMVYESLNSNDDSE